MVLGPIPMVTDNWSPATPYLPRSGVQSVVGGGEVAGFVRSGARD